MILLTDLFTTVLDMSIKALLPIVYVLIGDTALRLPNARRKWAYLLWIVVALRLMFPSFPQADSGKSLLVSGLQEWYDILPETKDFEHIYMGKTLVAEEGQPGYDAAVSAGAQPVDYGGSRYVVTAADGSSPAKTVGDLFPVLSVIWLMGMGGMVLWNLIAMLRLRRRLEEAVPMGDNVYLCDRIDNAFIVGLIYPSIYLPAGLSPQAQAHILAHERAHIRHSDHIFRFWAFALLCVHWFNPMVWVAYKAAMNDMEATCDESVFADMDESGRADYAQTLLNLSTGRGRSVVAPLAFGETHLAKRIRHILAYKAPGNRSMMAVLVLYIYAAGTCLTDPATDMIAVLDSSDRVPAVIVEHVAATTIADDADPKSMFLARSREFQDFAEAVQGTPILAYEPENYPAGIVRVTYPRSYNVIVVFYVTDSSGFYYASQDQAEGLGGDEQITQNWYTFARAE